MDIKYKSILLTGASGGLGMEMVSQFSKNDCRIIISDLHYDSLLKIKNLFPHNILGVIPADLSTDDGCNILLNELRLNYEIPDILINNAGIATFGKFCDTPKNKWEAVININLFAPMRITYSILNDMVKRKFGYVVNISSVAGLVASAGLSAYSTSKYGIRAFGESIYHEYKNEGIYVTNLYPFFTDTPILRSEQFGFKEKKIIPEFLLSTPTEVVDALIDGMNSNKLHVYPGLMSRTMEFLSRSFPGFIETLSERQMK